MDALVPRAQDAQEQPTRMDALMPREAGCRELPYRYSENLGERVDAVLDPLAPVFEGAPALAV